MAVNLNQLPTAQTLANSDKLFAETAGGARTVSFETLKQAQEGYFTKKWVWLYRSTEDNGGIVTLDYNIRDTNFDYLIITLWLGPGCEGGTVIIPRFPLGGFILWQIDTTSWFAWNGKHISPAFRGAYGCFNIRIEHGNPSKISIDEIAMIGESEEGPVNPTTLTRGITQIIGVEV